MQAAHCEGGEPGKQWKLGAFGAQQQQPRHLWSLHALRAVPEGAHRTVSKAYKLPAWAKLESILEDTTIHHMVHDACDMHVVAFLDQQLSWHGGLCQL